MKTLADFKRRLTVGTQVETNHLKLGSFGIRPISIVQSNSFAFKTTRDGRLVDSWCEYPKAKDIEFIDKDTVRIYWGEGDKREPILEYKFI